METVIEQVIEDNIRISEYDYPTKSVRISEDGSMNCVFIEYDNIPAFIAALEKFRKGEGV